MSTLSVQTITDVSSFDFANTQFAGAYDASNAAFNSANLSYNTQNVVFAVANASFNIANAALPNVSNAVFAGNLRVTGNLLIGMNTVTITDNHIISAEYYRMNTANHMVVIPDGNRVNSIFTISNTAFDTANAALPNTSGTFAGALTISTTSVPQIINSTNSNTYKVALRDNGTTVGYLGGSSSTPFIVANSAVNSLFRVDNIGNFTVTGNLTASSITTSPANGAYSLEYVIVGGGGAGGYRYGGGGAGGYLSSVQGEMSGGGQPARPVIWVTSGTSFTVTVGAGAVGNSNSGAGHGANGSNSSFGTLVAYGGGGGSCGGTSSLSDPLLVGWAGGCGGGSSGDGWGPANLPGGQGTYAQGFNGGYGWTQSGSNNGGGGGGAGGPGFDTANPNDAVGNGGIGVQTNISGTPTWYSGGGAGSCQTGNKAVPGLGGGAYYRQNGSTNTGGGGGSGLDSNSGGGGSGIVIVRYANATQRGTGGTVTSASINGVTYWIHTFTSSGTFTA